MLEIRNGRRCRLGGPCGEFLGKVKKSQGMDLGWQWNLSATPGLGENIAYVMSGA